MAIMSSVLCLSPSLTGGIHCHNRFSGICSSPETLNHLNSPPSSSSSPSCSSFDAPQLKRALAREESRSHLAKADASPNGCSDKLMRAMLLQRHRGLEGLEEEGGDNRSAEGEGDFDDPDAFRSLAKRQRPARLSIPPPAKAVLACSPLGRIDGPKEVEFEGDGYSVYCRKGRRRVMEDCFTAIADHQSDTKQKFFGVFDGHGGKNAAEFAANNLGTNIMNQAPFTCEDEENELKEAVRRGYLKTDDDFLKQQTSGGTCCLSAWFTNGRLVISNAGDCRAVLSRDGCAQALTTDHRPSREDERQRIEDLGGYVDFFHGAWRVQGTLAVSRGIGDSHLKKWVPAEPDTQILRIAPEHEFLIMATDGLWDKVGEQEAVDLARPLCAAAGSRNPDASSSVMAACRMLAELSVSRGSVDDVTVMIILTPPFTEGRRRKATGNQ